MSGDDEPFDDRETVEFSVTVPKCLFESLAREYDSAISPQYALRMAAAECLRHREGRPSAVDIGQAVSTELQNTTLTVRRDGQQED